MNKEGWMPREQILGVEAEARVPAEFIEQHPEVANPPSMFYLVDQLLNNEKLLADPTRKALLRGAYEKLTLWYNWLKRTQAGPKKGTFRWRGRNGTADFELNPKTLPSGLDDFPRASHPNDQEYHVDLRCWLALTSKVVAKMASLFDSLENARRFEAQADSLADFDTLVKLHWNEETKSFCDYGFHSGKVELRRVRDPKTGEIVTKRHTVSKPKLRLVDDTFGYAALFPLIMRLIPPDSTKLADTLDKIVDPDVLWTPYGLRSVSKKSPYYGAWNTQHDGPYWRGSIWININYMVADALKFYSNQEGPYRERCGEIYSNLRKAIVTNLATQFNSTGFIWEHYDDSMGSGKGSHPFNGWSSLVLFLMAD